MHRRSAVGSPRSVACQAASIASMAVEMLVLDEPTFSLDLVGQRAMAEALRAWPGGLVVASHDSAFLQRIGLDYSLELGKTFDVKASFEPAPPRASSAHRRRNRWP